MLTVMGAHASPYGTEVLFPCPLLAEAFGGGQRLVTTVKPPRIIPLSLISLQQGVLPLDRVRQLFNSSNIILRPRRDWMSTILLSSKGGPQMGNVLSIKEAISADMSLKITQPVDNADDQIPKFKLKGSGTFK